MFSNISHSFPQIDPKRAIPRDEQERTAKIFVGGVSQEASQEQFSDFFRHFGNVLDATLMMDKETGRPRGFGFVTFDSEAAVDRTLEGPLAICGKAIEVKRAQPRGDMRKLVDGPGYTGRLVGGADMINITTTTTITTTAEAGTGTAADSRTRCPRTARTEGII